MNSHGSPDMHIDSTKVYQEICCRQLSEQIKPVRTCFVGHIQFCITLRCKMCAFIHLILKYSVMLFSHGVNL